MEALYDYGRYKNRILGANSGITSFVEYHTLVVRWNGKEGERKEHQVAVGGLIEALKERENGWFPTGWSEIQFRYEEPFLKIELKIVSTSYPKQRYIYPLYQFEMR